MKILLFANTDWYLYNFRKSLALALREAGHDVILVSPSGEYGEKLLRMGFRWVAAPMNRTSLNPFRELLLILWLWRLLRVERVDIVHGFTIKCVVYGSVAAKLAFVPARVSAVAGLGYVFTSGTLKARILRPFVRWLLRATIGGDSARLILQNPDDVDLFVRSRIVAPEVIRLIYGSGVDCKTFSPSEVSNSNRRETGEAQPLRFLMPARLLWDKGIGEFVDAARSLIASGRNIEFIVAGDSDPGNPASVSKEILGAWVGDGVIRWLGHVEDMPRLYKSVDVVVLPSYREGLPKGLIEAGACGLALITTDVPGCREVVESGVDGLLVPARDSVALADAMARLADDRELRERLGRAARMKVLTRFDERIVLERTIGVYSELVANLPCPAGAGFTNRRTKGDKDSRVAEEYHRGD